MTAQLLVIIEELLPFVRGSDLLALALTCKDVKKRVFQSKRWKALPLLKNIEYHWNYGMVVINTPLAHKTENFDKYYKTGLPMDIHVTKYCRCGSIRPNSQWLKVVRTIEERRGLDLDYYIKEGLIPERLERLVMRNFSGNRENWKRLTQLKSLELYKTSYDNNQKLEAKIGQLSTLPKLEEITMNDMNLDFNLLTPFKNVTVLKIHAKEPLRNIIGLCGWKQLTELSIKVKLDDISYLGSLDNLEFFELDSSVELTKFPSSPPKKLDTLRLVNIRNENVDWLSGWTCLEDIFLSGPNFISINGLGNCANLKEAKITDSKVIQLKNLAKCKKLVKLDLYDCFYNDWDTLTKLNSELEKLERANDKINIVRPLVRILRKRKSRAA